MKSTTSTARLCSNHAILSARIQALHDYEEAKAAGAKPGDTRI